MWLFHTRKSEKITLNVGGIRAEFRKPGTSKERSDAIDTVGVYLFNPAIEYMVPG